jgi:carbamoylphosphate synthase large subunit
MKKQRILITSVGSLVGYSVLAALHPLRSRLVVIGCNTLAASPTVFDCDRAYRVPKTSDIPAYREVLRAIVLREQPDLIIPGRDEELAVLSELSTDPVCNAIRVLAPPPKLVPVFDDKLETARFAARHALPFAATACEPEEVTALIKAHGFPLVVKPRIGGHASKGVRIVADVAQLWAALAVGNRLAQECLNPETLSGLDGFSPETGVPLHHAVGDLRHAAEWLLDDAGEILSLRGVVSHTEGPQSMHMRLTDNAALVEVATGYARALAKAGHRGVANIQGKLLTDGRFVPFELNGRFTGSAVARAQMGCNQVAQAVCHFLWREPYTNAPVYPDTTALKSSIFRGVDQTAIDILETKGFWSADGTSGRWVDSTGKADEA